MKVEKLLKKVAIETGFPCFLTYSESEREGQGAYLIFWPRVWMFDEWRVLFRAWVLLWGNTINLQLHISIFIWKVTISFTIMNNIRGEDVMRVENDQFFTVRGGVRVMTHLQGLPMDQFGTSIDFAREHLTEKEPWCTSDVFHWIGRILAEVNTTAIISWVK